MGFANVQKNEGKKGFSDSELGRWHQTNYWFEYETHWLLALMVIGEFTPRNMKLQNLVTIADFLQGSGAGFPFLKKIKFIGIP